MHVILMTVSLVLVEDGVLSHALLIAIRRWSFRDRIQSVYLVL